MKEHDELCRMILQAFYDHRVNDCDKIVNAYLAKYWRKIADNLELAIDEQGLNSEQRFAILSTILGVSND